MSSLPFDARLRIAVSDFLEDAALAESVSEFFLKTLGVESTEHIQKYFKPRKEFKALKLRHVRQAEELKTFLLKRLGGGSQKAEPQQKAPPVQEADTQSRKRTAPPSAREESPPSGASRGLMANWMAQGASKKPKPDKPDKPDKPNKPLIFSNKPGSSGETAERPIRNRSDVAALMQRADLTDDEKVDRLVKCLKQKKDMELIQAWFTNLLFFCYFTYLS